MQGFTPDKDSKTTNFGCKLMRVYRCPKCGREVELPEGKYYCKVCGPSAVMDNLGILARILRGEPIPRLRWVRDLADIWWTATKDYIHSLYYDEEDKVYVWYLHRLEDFDKLKKEILYPPIENYYTFEARNIEEAKRRVEKELAGFLKPQPPAHPEMVDELVKEREKAYKQLKRIARKMKS